MLDTQFFIGFFAGFIAAGLLGFTLQQRRLARASISAFERPQGVGHQTARTPFQIFIGCLVGSVYYVIWTVVLLAGLLGFAWLVLQALV